MQSKLTRRAPAVNERYKSKKRCFEDTRDHHAPIESRIAHTTRARVQIELPKDLATLARCPPREMRVSPERQKKPPSDEKIARDNIPRAPLFRVYANHAFPETRSLRATQKQSSSTHRLLYVILAVMMVLP